MENDPIKSLDKKVIWFSIASIVLILAFVWYSTQYFLNFKETGTIGDTIGGLSMPLITIISSIIIYLSFREQFRANQLFIKENNKQKIEEKANRMLDGIIYDIEQMEIHTIVGAKGFSVFMAMNKDFYNRAWCQNPKIVENFFANMVFQKLEFVFFTMEKLAEHIQINQLYNSYAFERLKQWEVFYVQDVEFTLKEIILAKPYIDEKKIKHLPKVHTIYEGAVITNLKFAIENFNQRMDSIHKEIRDSNK